MNRFIVIDEFNDPIRTFPTEPEAKIFASNKHGFTVKEISLMSILGEARI